MYTPTPSSTIYYTLDGSDPRLAGGGISAQARVWVAGAVAFAFPILRQEDFRVLVMALVAATVAVAELEACTAIAGRGSVPGSA